MFKKLSFAPRVTKQSLEQITQYHAMFLYGLSFNRLLH